jgi:hypothetical protein
MLDAIRYLLQPPPVIDFTPERFQGAVNQILAAYDRLEPLPESVWSYFYESGWSPTETAQYLMAEIIIDDIKDS